MGFWHSRACKSTSIHNSAASYVSDFLSVGYRYVLSVPG